MKPTWATKAAGTARNRRAPQTTTADTKATETTQLVTRNRKAQPATPQPTVATSCVEPPTKPDKPYVRAGVRRAADWAPRYLKALEITGGNWTKAAKHAKVGITTVYDRRQRDPEFERDEVSVVTRSVKVLEAECIRRALDGVRKIRFQPRTGKVLYEQEYSDTLLLRALEHSETGSWRQKQQIEHSGGMTFKTRAERKEALEKARAAEKQQPVAALNGRS